MTPHPFKSCCCYIPGLAVLLTMLCPIPAFAEVRLPGILSDHAVLQRSTKTHLYGWAEPGEEVRASLGPLSSVTTTGPDGRWKMELNLNQSGPGPFELLVDGKNHLRVLDVLVGDVWLSSGQSNMQFTLNATLGGSEEIADSSNNSLRWFMATAAAGFREPQEDVAGKWFIASPETSGDCSGVAYAFGKKIQTDLKIPVGIILTAAGGSTIQSWMSEEALDKDPELKVEKDRILAAFRPADSNIPAQTKTSTPKRLKPPLIPTFYFNQFIRPLSSTTLRGFLWYQGEAHYNQGDLYARAFPSLIRDWRKAFAAGDLPFYFCQLPNTDVRTPDPGNEGWIAGVREAQDQTLKEPETGQAVLIDSGGIDAHPLNKAVVGQRLALLAEAHTYGQDVVAEGPRYLSATREGDKISLRFGGSSGLVAQPLPAVDLKGLPESQLQGFAICGPDKKWVWARAEIQDEKVLVWSPGIAQPAALRYAWSNNPVCNLFNKAGLPAPPFRITLP